MTQIAQTYLELLQASIWGDNTEIYVSPGDVTSIIRLATFQGTGPLINDQLLEIPGLEIPSVIRMQMKQQCVASIMQQQAQMPILLQACKALESADIHPVLLKGLVLAQYYPQPHLRQWGDIDLYVGQKQYHQACKVLNDVFAEADHPAEDDEERKHYNYVFPNTVLELHRISMGFAHPRDRKYYKNLEEAYLTKDGPTFEIDGQRITTPEETFNVFFTFLHAWHHFIETGMNMKQLCDVAVLLHAKRDVIDTERLREMLTKLHLIEVWQLFMYIMVSYLGLPKEECPFYTAACQVRAELLFERVLTESNARRLLPKTANGISYLKRKWITLQLRMIESRWVMPYAPRYARHMAWSSIVHGIERVIKRK